MSDSDQPLTEEQKQFVEDHMWMVRRHMRRFVMRHNDHNVSQNKEDLYQEGYLGLIYAVQSYDPDCDMTFEEWAFPRISAAISRAFWKLYPKVPVTRKQFRRNEPHPHVYSLERDLSVQQLSGQPKDIRFGETYRHRIHSICCQAVDETINRVSGVPRSLPNRRKVADVIARERIMTTDSHKTSIRTLFSDNKSTKGRLTNMEKQMRDLIELLLSRSRELGFLQAISSRDSAGLDEVIPDSVVRSLQTITTDQWLNDFKRSPHEKRKSLLGELLEIAEASQPGIVRALVSQLSTEERTRQGLSMISNSHSSKAA